ncbi:hypothetical protein E2C01_048801 [Portunus trituberculatus]|uniref:Uncharacterized protein n=1 Tax=Portunus trituberculatus TaxID=210409 RepID=A0A5B7G4N6_PORTR|nr:hypothetical protein [Portunus trituberculatus]
MPADTSSTGPVSPGTLQEDTIRLHVILSVIVIEERQCTAGIKPEDPVGELEGGTSWPAGLMFTPSGAAASSAPQLGPNILSSFNLSISLHDAAKAFITMNQGGAFASSREVEGKRRECWVADTSPLPEA